MYTDYFGLKENPFNVTSDPSYLYMSKHHQEAYSHLLYGIRQRKGFIAITGEIGTGKTTLCRALIREISDEIMTAFILNPALSELQLLTTILEDLGLRIESNSKHGLLKTLNNFLIEELSRGRNVVLIIDESQNLSGKLLEQVRMLSNLETEKEKLLQIVLVGQPQLREKLARDELTQLRQRIAVRYHILPLDRDDVKNYITHRLTVAGNGEAVFFNDDAIADIYEYTKGTPRLINVLCDKSLLCAYALQTNTISLDMVKRSIDEIDGRVALV